MADDFEIVHVLDVDATPEQVWDAIATGPGVDSWFMGRTRIEPGSGGRTTRDLTDVVGVVQEATITAWEPGRRLAFREDGEGGAFDAVEYLIEARGGGSTTVRFVHHGILAVDDWEAQYDGMRTGDRMFLDQLAVYLRHFAGRHATSNLFLLGPAVPDADRVRSLFASALSLTGEATPGARIRLDVPGLPAAEGVVEFVGPHLVGARTAHGIHLLLKGHGDVLAVGHHGFAADEDEQATAAAWGSWLVSAAGSPA